MISRRRFMQAGAATGVILAMPRWAFPFSQSPLAIRKFEIELPGLIADTTSGKRGIPVLTRITEGTPGVSPDVYHISATAFEQDLLETASSNFPHLVPLWGYASDAPGAAPPQYLGGVIVAQKGTAVELHVANLLPAHHILPTDETLILPEVRSDPGILRQDKIAIHLHGGFVFWHFDGGPFSWYTNPANSGGVWDTGTSFVDAQKTDTKGTAKYDYPNVGLSARTIWYHDHAYGLTRTNVFAGLASAYIITDAEEGILIGNGTLPGGSPPFNQVTEKLGIPLIVQDKTFWDEGKDPTYKAAVSPHVPNPGDLWYPHVYEGDLDGNLPMMNLPVPAPGNTNRWGSTNPAASSLVHPSSVPEYFSDTILVNGAPYPFLNVEPRRYRFRFINASQGRFYNLQLYVGQDNNPDGITLEPVAPLDTATEDQRDPNGNVLLRPTNSAGPAFVQIATEAGFMNGPVVFNTVTGGVNNNVNSNRILTYKNALTVATLRKRTDSRLNARSASNDPTLGGPLDYNLLVAPAERPDVIIDFTGFEGEEIILYNDAPAPFPGGDIRNDYFVSGPNLPSGYNNHQDIGGAPGTMSGQGPDTRVLMKFIVGQTRTEVDQLPVDLEDFPTWLSTLTTALEGVYMRTQPDPLPAPPRSEVRVKVLGEDNDEEGRLRQYLGNPSGNLRTYLDFPTDVAVAGEVQEWQIYNTTADTHPMHFHLVNVEVIRRERWEFNPADGTPILPLRPIPDSSIPLDPLDKNMASGNAWKDTVRMNPGEVTTVRMRFDLPPGGPPPDSPRLLATYGIKGSEYVWHCHILEHEEHDMMRPVVVIK